MKEVLLYLIFKFFDFFPFFPDGLPILLYHSIGEGGAKISVSVEDFQRQLDYLQGRGYRTIPPTKLDKFNRRDLMITFDDGFRNNYLVARPILARAGYRPVLFVSPKFISQKSAYCAAATDKNIAMLDWPEVKALAESGWFIGNHFYSHKNLTDLTATAIPEEFNLAKEAIQLHLPESCFDLVAYPRSKHNQVLIEVMKNLGVRAGFNGGNRWYYAGDDKLSISRIAVSGDMSFTRFKLALSPSFNFLKRLISR